MKIGISCIKNLIENFGFIKLDEFYDKQAFGNFYIILSSEYCLVRYIKDRSFLTIEIASHAEPSNWYDLSFIRNLIYAPNNINPNNRDVFSIERIEKLNQFLKYEFVGISNLFKKENYKNTKNRIDELLRQQFNERYGSK